MRVGEGESGEKVQTCSVKEAIHFHFVTRVVIVAFATSTYDTKALILSSHPPLICVSTPHDFSCEEMEIR